MDKIQLNDIPLKLKSLYCEFNQGLKSSSANKKFNCKCYNCRSWNTLRNFYRRNTNEKYRLSQNATVSNYKKNNPEKHRDLNKKWYHDNLDEARLINRKATRKRNTLKRSGIHSSYTESEILFKYGSLCHICTKEIDLLAPRKVGIPGWENGLHLDHVVAISKGGSDTIENVKPSHALCNIKKNAS